MKTKLKTHKGAAKRFSIRASGKVTRRQVGKRHLLSHKRARRKRQISGIAAVHAVETGAVRKMLPYG